MTSDPDGSDDEFFGKQEEVGAENLTEEMQDFSSKNCAGEGVNATEIIPESLSCRERKAQETIFRCVHGSAYLFFH
jgi:hypothetical protein